MWQQKQLGGDIMPEDVHPNLPRDSAALLHYFTLGMCLNYQRNSYGLWQAASTTFYDPETAWVFEPANVAAANDMALRDALGKYKVALQPNRHILNWRGVSAGILKHANGDLRNLLAACQFDCGTIRQFIQARKKDFPYLAGPKLSNYWLYVLTQYTHFDLINREALSVAPDTHVIQASVKLGLLAEDNATPKNVEVAWREILGLTRFAPIDIHTPLWLWSRGGFKPLNS